MHTWGKHRRIWVTCTMLVCAMMASGILWWQTRAEPSYGGQTLSEWLDAYDTNLRFDEEDGRRRFTDAQIERALQVIGDRAWPQLLKWVRARDLPHQGTLNTWLDRQRWIRFRFIPAIEQQCTASTGFMFYGSRTKPLQRALIRMTYDRDPAQRIIAYECFYFSRPERDVFLPVAIRGLQEPAVAEMTAQWLAERFAEDAERLAIRNRFPHFYQDIGKTGEDQPPPMAHRD